MRAAASVLAAVSVFCCLMLCAAAQSAAAIQIKDAWVRWLPGNLPAGAYLTLANSGDTAITLVGASSDDYGNVSLHQSVEHNGVANMSPVSAIVVKAHSTLEFASAGYHLMLQQPSRGLKPGDRIHIVLKFASGASVPAQFELRAPDAGPA